MSKAQKLIEQMRNNPLDWRIEQLETIAKLYAISVRKHGGGSHVIFDHPNCELAVSVPAKRPIKPIYIVKFLELIDSL